jgi:hypothetical protein
VVKKLQKTSLRDFCDQDNSTIGELKGVGSANGQLRVGISATKELGYPGLFFLSA